MLLNKVLIQTSLIILMVFSMNTTFAQTVPTLNKIWEKNDPDCHGGIYVDDTWVWSGDDDSGLWRAKKWDGSLAGYTTAGSTSELWDIYHNGGYFYAATKASKDFYIYEDVAGTIVGTLSLSQNTAGIFATGDYAYLAGDQGMVIVNVSNPANPSYVRTIDYGNDLCAIRGAGGYLYVSRETRDDLVIIEIIADPSNPTVVGYWDPLMSGDIRRLFVDETNSLVYVVNDRADLYIVDVSNPASPTTKGSLFLSGGDALFPGGGVYVEKNNAIVTTANGRYNGYLYWIDVSDPTNPTLVDSYYSSGQGYLDAYIEGNYVWTGSHYGSALFEMASTGYQPDGLISNTDESNYIGDGVYNSTGLNQTKSQQINYGDSATFKIKLENDSDEKQQLRLEGQSGTNGWTFIYIDDNNVDITTDVQNGTFLTDSLETAESTNITLKMVPDGTVADNTVFTDTLTLSAVHPFNSETDVVVASTTLLIGASSIAGYVWNDADNDGNWSVSEVGIDNASLYLLTTTGDSVATATTNSLGEYIFFALASGSYYVHVNDGTLPANYWTTTFNDPLLVTVALGADFTGANFGYVEGPDTDGDKIPDHIEGTGDRDGDGIPDNEDYDPAGYLYNEDTGEIVAGGLVDAAGPGQILIVNDGSTGEYSFFTDGTPGLYTITLTVPSGYELSTTCLPQNPPAYDPTGQSNPVSLGNSENGATGFLTSSACTPFYYTFDLEVGDPFIFDNNFPLKEIVYDFGDAPDPSYPTLLVNNGARHLIDSGYFLGANIDSDSDGQPNASSLGDDNDGSDDDDGITFTSPLAQSIQNSIDIVASANGYINAWMDFNRDGDWDDANENIISENAVTSGTNTINFQVPDIDLTGAPRTIEVSSRFRYSTQQSLSYTGAAPDGEVEDYLIDVLIPVELARLQAHSVEGFVQLSWSTFTETENLGFHIFRSNSKDGKYKQITQAFIPGAGNSESEKDYDYIDDSVKAGRTYYYRLADYSLSGQKRMHKPVKVFVELPSAYSLKQNYPNPFNPNTRIKFSIKEAGKVQLKIYNMQGQSVNTLMNRYAGPGAYNASWNGTNSLGQKVPSGVYYYELQVNDFKQSRKMVLTK
jgi:hypothetical protein